MSLFCASLAFSQSSKKAEASEEYKQFQEFMKFKEQADGEKAQDSKDEKVFDRKNFSIIESVRNSLREELENRRDVLSGRPADFKMAIDMISKAVPERKAMFHESNSVESAEKAIKAINDAYDEILPKIQELVIFLRCFDMISDNVSGIIETLQELDNIKILTQKDAENLWNKIEPALRYSSEPLQLAVKNIFIDAAKSNFEDKPNIPSYYAFHLMSNILSNLKEKHEKLNQAAFLRSFENAIYPLQKLISDFDVAIKSDQTPKNTITFFENAKKTTMSQLDFLQKRSKEWKEYISSLETLINRTCDIVSDCLKSEKDQSIFDHVKADGGQTKQNVE